MLVIRRNVGAVEAVGDHAADEQEDHQRNALGRQDTAEGAR